MFHTISEFLDAWKFESEATLKVLHNLTDASLAQRVTPQARSLGFLAWHITTTLSEMPSHAGLPVRVTGDHQPAPASAAEIAATYAKAAQAVAAAVKANWKDADLAGEIPMYGQKWTRSATLGALILHQCHHRGQVTVLMRQAGLKVPGIYGPAQEEWAAMGMTAQP
ncbi:MAG TPA: DinB family protein [Bryobacteraceae bacterium]|nr:DinB family protein [Bryobacteraceae bacterium]